MSLAKVATGLAVMVLASQPKTVYAEENSSFAVAMDAFTRQSLQRIEAVPGLAIAVVDETGPVYVGAFGVADVKTGAPVTADTRFYIASSTKAFTALAIAIMAERGEVDLDAPLASWAPETTTPALIANRITLTDLLSHRSGIENGPMAFRLAYSGEWTPEELWQLAAQTKSGDDAYGAFAYGNVGYNLATVLTERRWHRDWRDMVQEEVLGPLAMDATTARIDEARTDGVQVASGHLGRIANHPDRAPLQKINATMQSAGGLISTAHDMALWLEAQINDGYVGGRQVFPKRLVASTHISRVAQDNRFGDYQRSGYGLGWQIGSYGEDVLIHHFGNFSGSRAHVSFMSERRQGVVVLVNEDGFGGEVADIVANYAYDLLAGRADIEAFYEARLNALANQRDRRRAGVANAIAERAQRPRTLSQNNSAYTGRYFHTDYGTLYVHETEGRLEVSIGVMKALADYMPEPETIRVELVPLQGEVITFHLSDDGNVGQLSYRGEAFIRVDTLAGR